MTFRISYEVKGDGRFRRYVFESRTYETRSEATEAARKLRTKGRKGVRIIACDVKSLPPLKGFEAEW